MKRSLDLRTQRRHVFAKLVASQLAAFEVIPVREHDAHVVEELVPDGARLGLASLGVRWSVPRKRILTLDTAKRAADKTRIENALTAHERALFEAARANDRRKIVGLLAAGVNVDVRTVDGQWAYTPAGDTPLIQACA